MKSLIKKILKEEIEDDLEKQIRLFLLRRGEFKTHMIGDIKLSFVIFQSDSGEWYKISDMMSKREMIFVLINLLQEQGIIDIENHNLRQKDEYRQKVVRFLRKYINDVFNT